MTQSIKEKLKRLENQNRLLTDNLVEAVWLVNAGNLICEYITPSIQRINGYTAEELIDKQVTDGLVPESFKKAMVLLELSLDDYENGNRGIRTVEVEMKHKNGGTYWAEIRATLMEEAGTPLKIVGVMRDITARKTTELQLEEQNRKLVQALAEKEQLLKQIKVLEGLLPICGGCKRIRDDQGKWWPMDFYIKEHTEADFTHTICPDCKDVIYSK